MRREWPSTRAVLLLAWILLGALLLAFAWIGWRVWQVKGELEALTPLAQQARSAIHERDLAALDDVIDQTELHALDAARLTAEPTWGLLEALPAVGIDFAAVRTVSAQVDLVTRGGLSPLAEALEAVRSGASADGLDVEAVAGARTTTGAAAKAFAEASENLDGVRTSGLVRPVSDGVAVVADFVREGSPIVRAIDDAARVLPPMLGSEEPRRILVMIQNGAELRSGGGITGSYALLTADQGRLTIGAQVDSEVFPRLDQPIVALPDGVVQLYGDVVGEWVQNSAMPSDFAVTAQLAVEWWKLAGGEAPDAVISLDVPTLGAVLEATGATPLDDGRVLGRDDLVDVLLMQPYLSMTQAQQTEFQQRITRQVLDHALSAGLSPLEWGEALKGPIEQGRISVWSAHPDEQAVFEGTILAGQAARHAAADPAVAIYLNDATIGKLDLFLGVEMGVAELECRADGRRDIVVDVTLTNGAPADAGTRFPEYVTGGGVAGVPPGHISTNVTAAGPAGSFVAGVSIDGTPSRARTATESGFPSSVARVEIAPGESKTVEFRFTAGTPGDVEPALLHTPLLREPTITDIEASCG